MHAQRPAARRAAQATRTPCSLPRPDGRRRARRYVAQFHHPQSEISATRAVAVSLDDNAKRSTSVYRDQLYAEVARMKKEGRMDAHGGKHKAVEAR